PDAENSADVIRIALARIASPLPLPADKSLELQNLDPVTDLTDGQFRLVIDLLESVESAIAPTLQLEHFPRGRFPLTLTPEGLNTRLPHVHDTMRVHEYVLQPLLVMHLHEADTPAVVRDC